MEIQINNKEDFTALFNAKYNHLVIYLMRYIDNVSVAKDIAQEVFITLWEKRTNVYSPSSFLFVCGRNAAFKYLATNSKSQSLDQASSSQLSLPIEDDTLDYFERLEKIALLIENLPPQCKEVVKKIYFENKKIATVAVEMNLSVNTIKTHLKIAKNSLSKLFDILLLIFK